MLSKELQNLADMFQQEPEGQAWEWILRAIDQKRRTIRLEWGAYDHGGALS